MKRSPDDALIAELRGALAARDPVPSHLVTAAKECFSWKTIDEELAELVGDSATQSLVAVRSTSEPTESRLLTFQAPGLSVEVEITPYGDQRHLVGQLVPPRNAQVEVRWRGGSVTSQTDSIGLFSAGPVPAGPVSIACRPSRDGGRVVTSWVTI